MSSLARITPFHHATTLQCTSIRSTTTPSLKIKSAISIPNIQIDKHYLKKDTIVIRKSPKTTLPLENNKNKNGATQISPKQLNSTTNLKLNIIMEAVLDRIEMHKNIGEQRENWNSLLLNSLNMVTLTAATMAGLSGMDGEAVLPLKLSSFLLFSAATGIVMVMNKLQPSQLVEEQRNAVRKFKQLRTSIRTTLSIREVSEKDVEDAMERVLALDKAYPLPLLNGAMLDKYPKTFKPAIWWPTKKSSSHYSQDNNNNIDAKNVSNVKNDNNGWSYELEDELRDIVGVIEKRDIKDYYRLGNKALKLSKALAKTGPTLMGIAAVSSVFAGHGGPWSGIVAATAGSLASVVNTVQHGGQVGMVFEMYRNCAGFFNLMEENVESNLVEGDVEKRENGELFEMKMALQLGRSLSDLRGFASKSSCSWLNNEEESPKGEFASKLF